jgi:hypothetical protein
MEFFDAALNIEK